VRIRFEHVAKTLVRAEKPGFGKFAGPHPPLGEIERRIALLAHLAPRPRPEGRTFCARFRRSGGVIVSTGCSSADAT
jgi:hypothetical protein